MLLGVEVMRHGRRTCSPQIKIPSPATLCWRWATSARVIWWKVELCGEVTPTCHTPRASVTSLNTLKALESHSAKSLREYFAIGVLLVWVGDPESKSVHAYHSLTDVRVFNEGDDLTADDILPGFSVPVASLFED